MMADSCCNRQLLARSRHLLYDLCLIVMKNYLLLFPPFLYPSFASLDATLLSVVQRDQVSHVSFCSLPSFLPFLFSPQIVLCVYVRNKIKTRKLLQKDNHVHVLNCSLKQTDE